VLNKLSSFLVLQEGLAKHFASVQVSVVDCPDLTEKPFNLALPGILQTVI